MPTHVPCQHNHPCHKSILFHYFILNSPPENRNQFVNVFNVTIVFKRYHQIPTVTEVYCRWMIYSLYNMSTLTSAGNPLSRWAVCFTADICVGKRDKQRRQQERVVTEACLLQHLANVFNYLHVTLNHTADICFSLINWFHYSDCLSKKTRSTVLKSISSSFLGFHLHWNTVISRTALP